jgi:hypothetical protein
MLLVYILDYIRVFLYFFEILKCQFQINSKKGHHGAWAPNQFSGEWTH